MVCNDDDERSRGNKIDWIVRRLVVVVCGRVLPVYYLVNFAQARARAWPSPSQTPSAIHGWSLLRIYIDIKTRIVVFQILSCAELREKPILYICYTHSTLYTMPGATHNRARWYIYKLNRIIKWLPRGKQHPAISHAGRPHRQKYFYGKIILSKLRAAQYQWIANARARWQRAVPLRVLTRNISSLAARLSSARWGLCACKNDICCRRAQSVWCRTMSFDRGVWFGAPRDFQFLGPHPQTDRDNAVKDMPCGAIASVTIDWQASACAQMPQCANCIRMCDAYWMHSARAMRRLRCVRATHVTRGSGCGGTSSFARDCRWTEEWGLLNR